ncbi:hypothetical protein [Pseudemcibacter aquimaris]|uniref:hypothetical protein n=1 Tax=Pseudemcibacter aquimaris TaxID=2857064 RepID=UPI0020132DA1|nr:hypothetical protein [Pseudemcibacter aquimaris]MCC3860557.1 hypothetical protein [Pseudemcibacter aquimaris]WDU59380.1 hypothetical protein KW060_03775 [Pseudemcibacter aquimaris]
MKLCVQVNPLKVAITLVTWFILFFIYTHSIAQETKAPDPETVQLANEFITDVQELLEYDLIHSIENDEANILGDNTPEDLERIFSVAEFYFNLEIQEKLTKYAEMLLEKASLQNHATYIRVAHILKLYSISLDGNYSNAFAEIEIHLEEAEAEEDTLSMVIAYQALMGLAPLIGEEYSALLYAEKAKELVHLTPFQHRLELHHYNALTYIYAELRDPKNSILAAIESLNIIRNHQIPTDIATLIYNIGIALQDEELFALSRDYLTILSDFYIQSGQEI